MGSVPCRGKGREEGRQQRLSRELSSPRATRGLWTHQSKVSPGPSFPGHLVPPPWAATATLVSYVPSKGITPHPKVTHSLAGSGTAACLSLSPTFAQVTVGGGTPVALHRKVTASPSVAVKRTGPSSMLGGTGKEEKHLSLRGQGHIHRALRFAA